MGNESNARLGTVGSEVGTDNESPGLKAAKRGGKASAARRMEQTIKLETFRAELNQRVGSRDPIKVSLIDACCGLYLLILRRCTMTRGVNPKINPLALSAAVTGLKTTMRELGVLGSTPRDDRDEPPGGGLAEYMARKTLSEGGDDVRNSDV
jgi:hypothetical protein